MGSQGVGGGVAIGSGVVNGAGNGPGVGVGVGVGDGYESGSGDDTVSESDSGEGPRPGPQHPSSGDTNTQLNPPPKESIHRQRQHGSRPSCCWSSPSQRLSSSRPPRPKTHALAKKTPKTPLQFLPVILLLFRHSS